MRQPHAYFMVGLPGSGKSTVIETLLRAGGVADHIAGGDEQLIVLSTDAWIDVAAAIEGKTYDEVFSDKLMREAEDHLQAVLSQGLKLQMDIIWDQTNLTVKSRARKLSLIPDNYKKIAVFVNTPVDICLQRQKLRPGKTIPFNVFNSMVAAVQPPTLDNGFDFVYEVKT